MAHDEMDRAASKAADMTAAEQALLDGLEPYFAAARGTEAQAPSSDLMARILADAAEVQPAPQPAQQFAPAVSAQESSGQALSGLGLSGQAAQNRTGAPPRGAIARGAGLIDALLGALGGWPAAAGLAAVTACGVLVGLSPPAALSTALGTALQGAEAYETDYLGPATMLAGYDAFPGDG